MNETRLFYTPLWQTSMVETEPRWTLMRQAMLDKIGSAATERAQRGENQFRRLAERRGSIYKHPEFTWLMERVLQRANEVASSYSREKHFDDGVMWANVNGQFNFNAMHIHADALMSGVIYLKIAREDQGVIQFFDAREGSPADYWRCFLNLSDETEMTQGVVTVTPREGDILLFPGGLKHWVTPNLTDDMRVAVSFNLTMS